MTSLIFRPIDLEKGLATAWSLRAEPNPAHTDPLPWSSSRDFLDNWVLPKLNWHLFAAIHVWEGDRIIGQIESTLSRFKSNSGYVNFYYLIPSHRNRGLSSQLVEFTDTLFRNHNLTGVQLSPLIKRTVLPSSAPARTNPTSSCSRNLCNRH